MRLAARGAPHLTYCTNIHPGETWAEVRANVEQHVPAVRERVAPGLPFGVGLRLSGRAAAELLDAPDLDVAAQTMVGRRADPARTIAGHRAGADSAPKIAGRQAGAEIFADGGRMLDLADPPRALRALQELLAAHGLYVFTINGFPYGPFHGAPVKEAVYRPDWREDARVAYSDRLAWILAALLPEDPAITGSVSTVPGAFKPRVRREEDRDAIIERLIRHAATLHGIRERTGKLIRLALEPEPCCLCETVAETIALFERLFAPSAARRLAELTGLGVAASEDALRRHLGVCFDACHMAVEFEEPGAALAAFAAAGISVAKIQISAGLEVDARDAGALAALAAFAESTYLHQVVVRTARGLRRYLDLPEALAAAAGASASHPCDASTVAGGSESRAAPEPWRIHFHVPLFREQLGPFRSTQPWVRALLEVVRHTTPSPHLEVETYTWDVLPAEYRDEPVDVAIARELAWVRDALESAP